MDWSQFSVTDYSAGGLLAIAVLMVLWGKLVAKSVVDDIRTDRDARLVEARSEIENWKSAYDASEEARRLQAQQVGELLELAKMTDQFVRSLPAAAKKELP